jgi:hypothetical protein
MPTPANYFKKGNKLAVGHGRPKLPPEVVSKISKDLIEWSESPESMHFAEFATKNGRAANWLYHLVPRHPEIKEAFEIARSNLLIHYLRNGLKGKWNQSIVHRYLGYFDEKLTEYEDEREEKKRRTDKEIADIVVTTIDYSKAKCNDSCKTQEK